MGTDARCEARRVSPTSHRLCTCEDTSVSSLWTPSGEHQPPDPPTGPGRRRPVPERSEDEREPTAEEVEALREVHARLVATPVGGRRGQPRAGHLAAGARAPRGDHAARRRRPARRPRTSAPPASRSTRWPRSWTGSVSDSGSHEPVLRDALTQAQMLFVEISESGPDSSK